MFGSQITSGLVEEGLFPSAYQWRILHVVIRIVFRSEGDGSFPFFLASRFFFQTLMSK